MLAVVLGQLQADVLILHRRSSRIKPGLHGLGVHVCKCVGECKRSQGKVVELWPMKFVPPLQVALPIPKHTKEVRVGADFRGVRPTPLRAIFFFGWLTQNDDTDHLAASPQSDKGSGGQHKTWMRFAALPPSAQQSNESRHCAFCFLDGFISLFICVILHNMYPPLDLLLLPFGRLEAGSLPFGPSCSSFILSPTIFHPCTASSSPAHLSHLSILCVLTTDVNV